MAVITLSRQSGSEGNAAHIDFVKRFYDADISDPTLYDLIINPDKLTRDAAASLIIQALGYLPERA